MGVDEKSLLDWGAKIGFQAKMEGVRRSQFEGILASLELAEDSKNSLLLTSAYAHRQAQRLRGRRMANLINKALNMIFNQGGGKKEARKLLGIAKWILETVEPIRIERIDPSTLTFEEYIRILRSE